MGFEIEPQFETEFRQIKARELQLENVEKLNNVSDALNDIDLASIETNTNDIKDLIVTNIDSQIDLDEIFESVSKIAQGISDIKRSQTNLNKKINELQEKINEINEGE